MGQRQVGIIEKTEGISGHVGKEIGDLYRFPRGNIGYKPGNAGDSRTVHMGRLSDLPLVEAYDEVSPFRQCAAERLVPHHPLPTQPLYEEKRWLRRASEGVVDQFYAAAEKF